MGMKKLKLKISDIFKNCGIGTSHVINKDNQICIRRYGVWCPYFTIYFSKILPLKELYEIEQMYHSHQGNFFSIILWGTYKEEVLKDDDILYKEHKWFNYITHDLHHKVVCDKPCYTVLFMGRKKSNTTVRLKQGGKVVKHQRFFKLIDEQEI